MMLMKCNINKQDRYTVVKVEEDKLNSQVAPELKAQFVYMNGKDVKNIIVDLGAVKYCDSSGLSAILVGNRLCKNAKGSFVITGLQEAVKKLISISQLDTVLTITPTIQEATDIVLMDEIERDIE